MTLSLEMVRQNCNFQDPQLSVHALLSIVYSMRSTGRKEQRKEKAEGDQLESCRGRKGRAGPRGKERRGRRSSSDISRNEISQNFKFHNYANKFFSPPNVAKLFFNVRSNVWRNFAKCEKNFVAILQIKKGGGGKEKLEREGERRSWHGEKD